MSGVTAETIVVGAGAAVIAAGGVALLVWLSLVRPRLGLYAMLALAPTQFIFIPVSNFFVSPADVLALAGAAGLAFRLSRGRARTIHAAGLHVWLAVMIGAYLVGFLVLDHISRTLIRVPLAIVPSVLACELLRDRRDFTRAIGALMAAGFVDALYGVYLTASGQPAHPTRFSGMMGVNFSAIVIIAGAAMGFAWLSRTRAPLMLVLPGALGLFGLATLSKMGIIALVVTWFGIVTRVATRTNRRLLISAAVVLVAAAAAQDSIRERVLARARPEMQLDGVHRTSTDVRLLILRSAWAGLADQPFVGVGYFNFEAYSRRDPEIHRSTGGAGYGTHNTYLEILVEGGLLAFVPFLLHFVSSAGRFAHAWRAAMYGRDVTAAASLAGFLVVLTAAGVANVLLHFVFWSVCGVALAYARTLEMEARAGEPAVAGIAPSPA